MTWQHGVLGGGPARASAQRSASSADAVSILTVYLVLLIAIPTDLRIPALGGAGSLATLWALAGGLAWCWFHLQRDLPVPRVRRHPVRIVALLLIASVLASYIAAMTRPLSVVEGSQADIGILRILAAASLVLLASDSITSMGRMRELLERFAWIVGGLAALGLLQFVTGRTFVEGFSLPGMVSTQDYDAIVQRGDFIRAAGTAMSPLEYAAALSAAFPIALTHALSDDRRSVLWRSLPAVLIAAALLVSGSRSGLLGLAIGVIAMLPFWSARIRLRVGGLAVVSLVALFFLVPGMIGTLRYLFTQTSNDPSAQSRTGSYEIVGAFFRENPVFGRGFGTFLPQYRILDNQYLLMLIETGIVGVALFTSLFVVAAVCAILARKSFGDHLDRQLGAALAAGTLAAGGLAAFFDAMAFPMAVGAMFLMAGMCGGYWRLAQQPIVGAQIAAQPSSV